MSNVSYNDEGQVALVIDGLQPQDSGGFWAYDGQRLPW